ncbi:hypothetical protein PAE9249_02353 [Paenibacillus sp. CECT 9249]|uniref:phosphatidate cytidylyltransferase n=1 Tax=Paenibacillus sp. CECT 9249 TaxID=2845385 RepID=UPI001E538177|nr:phosphatidate cytidylyltransferase [Paenibacillus sp. CECT 9249]CAH0119845.1 hypothetical protein PAE9249_02353 [Paenibacillus sp. CECT 9249]
MKQRVITGFIAGTGFILCCILGEPWYNGLMILLSLVGYYEFIRMNGLKPWNITSLLGFLGVLYFVFPWSKFPLSDINPSMFIWLMLFLFLTATVITKNKIDIDKAANMLLGVLYIGIGFQYMIETRSAPDGNGLFWSLLLFAAIWSSDAGAYFTGRRFGKTKLWPDISPNKTVEGAIGGIVVAAAVSALFVLFAPELLPIGRAIWIGLAASVIGQIGDLIQSAYKRVRGVKDTGSILPGHGGILDRVDSWLIVFPFIHLLSLLPYQ